jgi:hypothetical protein
LWQGSYNLNFSDNYMRIRQKANTTDRRFAEFKFVSLYSLELTLHIGVMLTFTNNKFW